MAEALVRHDELIADAVEARGGSLIKSMGEGDSTVSVFDSAPAAVEAALAANRALAAEAVAAGHPHRRALGHPHRRGRAARRRLLRPDRQPRRARARAGRRRRDPPLLGDQRARRRAPARGLLARRPRPAPAQGLGAPERIYALAGPGVRTPPPAADCPYRGLLAFEAGDRAFFFGREAVVAELVGRLAPGRLLAVVGASGSGKSSVLRAGLVAAARAGEVAGLTDAVVVTPGAEPALDVARRAGPARSSSTSSRSCSRSATTRTAARVHRRAAAAARAPSRSACAPTSTGGSARTRELARAVAGNQVLLGADDRRRARARDHASRRGSPGLQLEPGLVELILRDVAAEPGALPLLSHALRATWERRDGRTLTVEGYRESGGVASAIAAHRRRASSTALPAEQRPLARSVFLRMTELGEGIEDSRRRVAVDELVPEGAVAGGRRGAARAARRGAPRHARRRHRRGRPRGADPRVAAAAPLARRGPRRHPRAPPARRRRAALGRRRPRGVRPLPRRPARRRGRARAAGRRAAQRDRARVPRRQRRRGRARAARRAAGEPPPARPCSPAAPSCSSSRSWAPCSAVVSRSNAQDAESRRRGAGADGRTPSASARSRRPRRTLEQSMLYGAAAVELEDRVQTRGELLAALQRNRRGGPQPRVVGRGRGAAVSPDGLLASGGPGRRRALHRPAHLERRAVRRCELGRPVTGQAIALLAGRPDARGRDARRTAARRCTSSTSRPGRPAGSAPGAARSNSATPDDRARVRARRPPPRRRAFALDDVGAPTAAQRLVLLDARSGRRVWQRRYPHQPGQWEAHVGFSPTAALITSAAQGETLVWDARRAGSCGATRSAGGSRSRPRRRIAIALNSAFAGDPQHRDRRAEPAHRQSRTLAPQRAAGSAAWPSNATARGSSAAATEGARLGRAAGQDPRDVRHELGPRPGGVVLDPAGSRWTAGSTAPSAVWDPDGDAAARAPLLLSPQRRVPPRTRARWSTRAARDGDEPGRRDRGAGRPAHQAPDRGPAGPRRDVGGGDRVLVRRPPARHRRDAGSVTIRDVRSRAIVHRLRFPAPVAAVAISPDGRLLAVAAQAREPPSRTSRSATCARTRRVFTSRSPAAGPGEPGVHARQPRARRLGCCSGLVVPPGTRARASSSRVPAREQARTFALSPDSRLVAVGTANGRVRLGTSAPAGRAAPRPRSRAPTRPARRLARRPAARRGRARRDRDGLGPAHAQRLGESFPVLRAWSRRSRSSPTAG